jgi:hypothetical protein
MDTGLYLTFSDPTDTPATELPPVGPLDHVVMSHDVMLAERRVIVQASEIGVAISRWLEAELEMQRATGNEPGGTRRRGRRLVARDGVYLRFVDLARATEPDTLPEFGPFAVVRVEQGEVEADGTVLARQVDGRTWSLSSTCGTDLAGLRRPDIAFRTADSAYHRSVAPLIGAARAAVPTQPWQPPPRVTPPAIEPATIAPPLVDPAPKVEEADAPVFAMPPGEWPSYFDRSKPRADDVAVGWKSTPPSASRGDESLSLTDRATQEATLRSRLQGQSASDPTSSYGADTRVYGTRHRSGAAPAAESIDRRGGLQWGAALWRTRFLVIGVLLVFVSGYYLYAFLTGGAPSISGGQQMTYVGLGERFSSASWQYSVNGIEKAATAGVARPRWQYYIVRMEVTNRGAAGPLSPRDFTVIGPSGTEYSAEGLTGGVYQNPENLGSSYVWPTTFPRGQTLTVRVVFDIEPGATRGLLLRIPDLPSTRVRLD